MIGFPRIYGFLNGMWPDGRFIVTAVTEYGKSICSVVVKSEEEGKVALGMNGRSLMSHDKYQRLHPEGVTVEWVGFDKTMKHPGLRRALDEYYKRVKSSLC